MKKNRKRLFCYILIAFFDVVVITSYIEAATLIVGSNSGYPGEEDFSITINLTSPPTEEVCSFNFDLTYDTSRISFKEVVLGPKAEEADKLLFFSRPSNDVVRVIVIALNQNVIDSGIALYFKFNILNTAPIGRADLTITNPSVTDPQGILLPIATEDGVIIVGGDIPVTSTTTTLAITTSTTMNVTTTIIPTTSPNTTSTTINPTETTTSINSTSSITTTSLSQLWPLLYDQMWGHKKDQNIFILRTFRDEVLINCKIGKKYISMIYNNSLEISILLYQDHSLIVQTAKVVDELLSGIQSLVYNNEITISQITITAVESLLNQLESKASPRLKNAIKKAKKDIRGEMLFKKLGIKKLHNTRGYLQ